MNTKGTSDRGRAFDRYLQGDSELSRLYKETATERAPVDLDAAVLTRAQGEAVEQRHRARGPFTRTWFIPVSLAAVLVLTVGLVTFMYEQESRAPFTPEPAPSMEEGIRSKERDSLLGDAPQQDEKAILRKTMPASEQSPARQRAVVPQEAGDTASPAPAPTAVPSQLEERELKQERHEAPKKAGRADELAPATAVAPEMLSPEAWLRNIAELRQQGKLTEADASLAQFKERYPDYPIETILE